tara:strand:- start:1233 stop:1739 length:507 start_codon:yes stop_codon:yes gene_type:complete
MIMIGVDPGQTGGIAVIKYNNGYPVLLSVIDMPVVEVRNKKSLNAAEAHAYLSSYYPGAWATVEEVSAMPKQGVSSTFQFGRMYGAIEGILDLNADELIYAKPNKWKQFFGLRSIKGEAIDLAIEIFGPHTMFTRIGPRGGMVPGTDGCAEAALIALYGAKFVEKRNG